MKAINKQTSSQSLTVESVKNIAQEWMELADKDNSGTLDFKEFSDFFSKIEGTPVTQQEILTMFKDFDTSGDDQLSVEEFARAIYNMLLADNADYTEEPD